MTETSVHSGYQTKKSKARHAIERLTSRPVGDHSENLILHHADSTVCEEILNTEEKGIKQKQKSLERPRNRKADTGENTKKDDAMRQDLNDIRYAIF